jgi:hypothetical protein
MSPIAWLGRATLDWGRVLSPDADSVSARFDVGSPRCPSALNTSFQEIGS